MKEPKYLSEYLEDFIAEEEIPKNGKINWKYLLILLFPFGTLILISLLFLRKINRKKNSKETSKESKT